MSVHIRIIGKGCFFCKQLRKIVDDLVGEMGLSDAKVEQVDEMEETASRIIIRPAT